MAGTSHQAERDVKKIILELIANLPLKQAEISMTFPESNRTHNSVFHSMLQRIVREAKESHRVYRVLDPATELYQRKRKYQSEDKSE